MNVAAVRGPALDPPLTQVPTARMAPDLQKPGSNGNTEEGPVIPPLVQICIVLVALAFVAIAITTIRAMKTFQKAADEFRRTSETVQRLTNEVQQVGRSMKEIGAALRESVERLQGIGTRFGGIRRRAAHLTNGQLDDVRETVRRVTTTMRAARELTGMFRKVAYSSHPLRPNGG